MNQTEFLIQLDDLLELEAGTLKGPERLENIDGWNSLTVIGFMALANDEFGVVVSPRRISECGTVEDLVALVLPR